MNEEFIKEIIIATISGEPHLGTNLKEQCLTYFDHLISENKQLIEIVKRERKRINKLVEDINIQFYDYLKKQNAIISKKMEPFKMIKSDYENYIDIESIHCYETVRIRLEPFDICFLQEKMDKLGE